MKKFKNTIYNINRTFGCAIFGAATMRMFFEDYKIATYLLFIVATLFIVGYFAERWSNETDLKRRIL